MIEQSGTTNKNEYVEPECDWQHLLDDIHQGRLNRVANDIGRLPLMHPPKEVAPNGASTAGLAFYGIVGATAGFATGTVNGFRAAEAGSELHLLDMGDFQGAGVMRGLLAAGSVAGGDMLLQRAFGHDIHGHDFLRPTGLEMLGFGVAAAAPMDMKMKLGLAGLSWLAGRVENYFDA